MQRVTLLSIFILFTAKLYAQNFNFKNINKNLLRSKLAENWRLSDTQVEYLLSGKVISTSKVTSEKNIQNLFFKISAIHPKSCKFALKTLSVYENFKNYMDFVKQSDYDEKTNHVYFLLESSLLPYRMSLRFKIPRIQAPGVYPYVFLDGIFQNLSGNIEVHDLGENCLFFTNASWTGPDTKIPDVIIEMFSETLTRKSFEKLFRISSI